MTDPIEPRIVRPEDRDGLPTAAGGDIYATLARGEHTHGGYFLTHAIVPPGGGPPAHVHTREEEAFYILRGEIAFSSTAAWSRLEQGRSSTFRAARSTASATSPIPTPS